MARPLSEEAAPSEDENKPYPTRHAARGLCTGVGPGRRRSGWLRL